MTRIFISYRRADSRKDAGRIYDRFAEVFGKENVFKDVDNIPYGVDFRTKLVTEAKLCDVMLVIIGAQWLTVQDKDGKRRLDDPEDYVRTEIETALARDRVLVVPVLVDGAPMPGSSDLPATLGQLAYHHAMAIHDDPDFHYDVGRLLDSVCEHTGTTERTPAPSPFSTTPAFDVHAAITTFYRACDEHNWEQARMLLTQIRSSGKAPRVFNVDQQEKIIWEAIEKNQRDAEYNVVRLMAKHDKPGRVLEALRVFWESYPGYDPDHLESALTLTTLMSQVDQAEKAGLWDEVIDLGEMILASDYDHELAAARTANAYQERGVKYRLNRDYTRAVADFSRAIEILPNNAELYRHRGLCYHYAQGYTWAIADFTRAIELTPNNATYFYMRAATYAQMPGKEAEHRADLEKSAALGNKTAQEELKKLKGFWGKLLG